MFDRFMKLTSSSGEQRLINPDRVKRISMAVDDAGEPVMASCFDESDRVLVHGDDEDSRILIRRIAASLDAAATSAGVTEAA
ncbi:MAG: hypothetical protein HUU19_13520 [Phycisphaerales bacterium]|nr:hypothetical protein [Phycisphaerales bacterium]